jgi:alpha-mannosidase
VVGEAARFETPLRWAPGAAEPASLFSVDDPNLVLDTVKRAEGSEALVLRLYEAHGARGTARLRIRLPFAGGASCNLLEDPGEPLETDGDVIVVPYRPHEIVSLLVR